MPYKNKEDRAEAVRRYRKRIDTAKENQKWIGSFLTEHCGFDTMPFWFIVKKIQDDCILEEDRVRSRSTGKLMDDFEVYVGLNTVVLVETTHVTVKPH